MVLRRGCGLATTQRIASTNQPSTGMGTTWGTSLIARTGGELWAGRCAGGGGQVGGRRRRRAAAGYNYGRAHTICIISNSGGNTMEPLVVPLTFPPPCACALRPRSTHHAGLGLYWGPSLLPQPWAGRCWPPEHPGHMWMEPQNIEFFELRFASPPSEMVNKQHIRHNY